MNDRIFVNNLYRFASRAIIYASVHYNGLNEYSYRRISEDLLSCLKDLESNESRSTLSNDQIIALLDRLVVEYTDKLEEVFGIKQQKIDFENDSEEDILAKVFPEKIDRIKNHNVNGVNHTIISQMLKSNKHFIGKKYEIDDIEMFCYGFFKYDELSIDAQSGFENMYQDCVDLEYIKRTLNNQNTIEIYG